MKTTMTDTECRRMIMIEATTELVKMIQGKSFHVIIKYQLADWKVQLLNI